MNMRASEASKLRKFAHFTHSNTAISFNSLLVLQILCLRNIYFQVSNNICIHRPIYTINAVSFYHLWYEAIYKQKYTEKTLTFRKCRYKYMWASELRKFLHFYILKLLFPSIFCWYFRYFGISWNFKWRTIRPSFHDLTERVKICNFSILSFTHICTLFT